MAINRREFVKAAIVGGAASSIPRRLHAATGDFRALICIQQGGGCDNFLFAIPTDTARRNALIARRGNVLTNYYSDPNLLALGYGTNVAMHPGLKPLEPYLSRTRLTLGVANTMHVANSGSHEIQQIRMSLGTDLGANRSAGWKARLYDTTPIRLMGFSGIRPQDVACVSARCQAEPPLVLNRFSEYQLAGASFNSDVQGGTANTRHVSELVAQIAQLRVTESDPATERYRSAQHRMLTTTEDISYTVNNYITPRHNEYESLYDPAYDSHGYLMAIRFRDIAQYLYRMREEGSSDRILITVPHGGYDSHSNFVAVSNWLMVHLGRILKVFIDDLVDMGIFDHVLIQTETEFGRQIQANGLTSSDGTDHGVAFNTLTIGGRVRGGPNTLWGDMISPTTISNEYGWPRALDYRSLLSEIIENHLGYNPMTTAFSGAIGSEFTRTSLSLFDDTAS